MRIGRVSRRVKEIKLPTAGMLNDTYGKLQPKSDFIGRQYRRGKLAAKVARNIAEQLHERGIKVDVELAQKMAFSYGALKHFSAENLATMQRDFKRKGYARFAKGIDFIGRGVTPESIRRMPIEEKIFAYADYLCRGVKDSDGTYVQRAYTLDSAHEIAKKVHDERIHPFIAQKYEALRIIEQELIKLGFNTGELQRIRI